MALANWSIHYTWKIIKSGYKNNKFQIFAPTWNNEFDLPDGSYSKSDIQDYFDYIIKKHEAIRSKIILKINTGYKLESLSPETMKWLGSTRKRGWSRRRLEKRIKIEIKIEKMYQNLNLSVVLVNCVVYFLYQINNVLN